MLKERSWTIPAWRAEIRACLALSWPLILTNAIEMAMNLTNVALIARIGPDALAASTLALALFHAALLFGIGVIAAVPSLLSHEIGHDGVAGPAVRHIVQQGIWAAAFLAVPAGLVLSHAEAILVHLGQPPALASQAGIYLGTLQWAVLPALIYLVLRSLFASLDRPRVAVVVGVIAICLNAALNALLIFGHGPVPGFGIAGSGVATLLSNLFMAAALALAARLHPRTRDLRLSAGLFWPNWRGFGQLWRIGLPIGVALILETGMFAAAALLVGLIDATSLAAHAIALQVASFAFMVPLGIAQAATIRVGRAAGAGDADAMARSGWTALGVGLTAMLTSATILLTLPRPIIGLFLDRTEPGTAAIEPLAIVLLGLAGLFQLADGGQVVLAGMLRGLHDTRVPMLAAALGYWGVGLPLGAILAFGFGLQAPGVWLGLAGGLFCVAALLLSRWRWQLARFGPTPPS